MTVLSCDSSETVLGWIMMIDDSMHVCTANGQ